MGVGVLEMPAETEAKAGVWRTLYVRRYIIPLESIKGGPRHSGCKLPLTSSNIPEPVFPNSHGDVGAEEILNKIIWAFLLFSSQFLSLQVTSNSIF